ncbi:hypothetical protein ZWY2020_026156 [Hordeum vulgare]|nr:hypothetical protein ZWY2020_026156 [Hordeum vulgare]
MLLAANRGGAGGAAGNRDEIAGAAANRGGPAAGGAAATLSRRWSMRLAEDGMAVLRATMRGEAALRATGGVAALRLGRGSGGMGCTLAPVGVGEEWGKGEVTTHLTHRIH